MIVFANGEDLKVLYVSSGYLTEDCKCGYDERAFVVRKEWLAKWYNKYCAAYIKENISLETWLNDFYESSEAYNVYLDAKQADEVVIEQNIWNNKACFYEVWEESIVDGEHEMNTIIRTSDLERAKKEFRKAKQDAMTDSIIGTDSEYITENVEDYESGEARLVYDRGEYFYGLYLVKREVELEDWKNA